MLIFFQRLSQLSFFLPCSFTQPHFLFVTPEKNAQSIVAYIFNVKTDRGWPKKRSIHTERKRERKKNAYKQRTIRGYNGLFSLSLSLKASISPETLSWQGNRDSTKKKDRISLIFSLFFFLLSSFRMNGRIAQNTKDG